MLLLPTYLGIRIMIMSTHILNDWHFGWCAGTSKMNSKCDNQDFRAFNRNFYLINRHCGKMSPIPVAGRQQETGTEDTYYKIRQFSEWWIKYRGTRKGHWKKKEWRENSPTKEACRVKGKMEGERRTCLMVHEIGCQHTNSCSDWFWWKSTLLMSLTTN